MVADSIRAVSKALDLYDILIRSVLNVKDFEQLLAELNEYGNGFTLENTSFIANVKTHIMNGIDAYLQALQSIYESVSFAESQLKMFIKLFDGYDEKKAKSQKRVLSEMLNNAARQMQVARTKLHSTASSFNLADPSLKTLASYRLGSEFDEAIENFEKNLEEIHLVKNPETRQKMKYYLDKMLRIIEICVNFRRKLVQINRINIPYAVLVLLKEIQLFSKLKEQLEQTIQNVDFNEMAGNRDMYITFAQHVINKSEEYRETHKHIRFTNPIRL